MPPLVPSIVVLLAVYLLAECLNLFIVGTSLTRGICRVVRQIRHGSKEMEMPEDLKLAAANGLLSVGSEVVVGSECEWTGTTVSRFAVSPDAVNKEPGTLMKVVRLTRDRIELRTILREERGSLSGNAL